MDWTPPQRPAAYAEQTLVHSILSGKFPPGAALPAERELAALLGVTRPTLREALQRLARDGWLDIQHGKPTRVNDFWTQGGLNVLSALARYSPAGSAALPGLPADFVLHLLEVRLVLAPAYARQAVLHNPAHVSLALQQPPDLESPEQAFAAFDWELHHRLTVASANPIYTLILNGFSGIYLDLAARYFTNPAARGASLGFYSALAESARAGDPAAAELVTRQAMLESIALFQA